MDNFFFIVYSYKGKSCFFLNFFALILCLDYFSVGVYNVTVEASNALNSKFENVKPPITVQIPPSREIHIKPYFTGEFLRVNPVNFSVTLLNGTNVTCDWSMGDQQDNINVTVVDQKSSGKLIN